MDHGATAPLGRRHELPRFACPAAQLVHLPASQQGALELGCQSIKVQGDSTLIIRQVGF